MQNYYQDELWGNKAVMNLQKEQGLDQIQHKRGEFMLYKKRQSP